jgi:hypothetical protein
MNKVFFSLTTKPRTHNQLKVVKQGNQAPTKTNPPTQPSKTKNQKAITTSSAETIQLQ